MNKDDRKDLEGVRTTAREKMRGHCGVYRICDGADNRICQGNSYGAFIGIGGMGSGASFYNNVEALKKIKLKMRVIGPDFEPDTTYDFFGKTLSMPIMGASATGVNSFGGEDVITEKEFCHATVFGCKHAGTVGFRGDTYTYSFDFMPGYDAISSADGWGVKIAKPRDQETLIKIYSMYEKIGAIAVGIDVDGCKAPIMTKYGKTVYRKSIEDLKELINSTSLPFIVKGIMTPEDALAAVEAGADAIVVSNHGGRVLDHTPGTAEVLPSIVQEVKGKTRILVDSGIRTGYDVLKVLALGAESALIGRDIIRAAVGFGAEGVKIHMEYLQKTLAKAMKMTNCPRLKDISADVLY